MDEPILNQQIGQLSRLMEKLAKGQSGKLIPESEVVDVLRPVVRGIHAMAARMAQESKAMEENLSDLVIAKRRLGDDFGKRYAAVLDIVDAATVITVNSDELQQAAEIAAKEMQVALGVCRT